VYSVLSVILLSVFRLLYVLEQGSQTHLGVWATLQDISPSAGHTVFRDDKNAVIITNDKTIIHLQSCSSYTVTV